MFITLHRLTKSYKANEPDLVEELWVKPSEIVVMTRGENYTHITAGNSIWKVQERPEWIMTEMENALQRNQ